MAKRKASKKTRRSARSARKSKRRVSKRKTKIVRRKKVVAKKQKLSPYQRHLVSGPWETFSKKQIREMTSLLVDQYLRSKKRGHTIKKIPTGQALGVKAYRWR